MTLREVMRSGKRYRRESWASGYECPPERPSERFYSQEDIEATDWILEPEPEQKIELTKKQIAEAIVSVKKVFVTHGSSYCKHCEKQEWISFPDLWKFLGFTEEKT